MTIDGIRLVGDETTVPVVGGGTTRHLNLDFAASAPALASVRDAVEEFLPWYSSVHRGAGYKSRLASQAYEAARAEVAAFVNARPDDVVVFTRNATDSLNLLSAALPHGTQVVAFDAEHHANLLPWRRHAVRHLRAPAQASDVGAVLDGALSGIGPGPVLVAVTAASNVTGEIWPVGDVVRVAQRHGAKVVVDAAQLAPHGPVDLAGWGADWVAFSGHKLYAPYGAGALVGRTEWLEEGEPFLRGGGAVRFVTLDHVDWASAPDRLEAGSPNVVGAVAMGAACRELRRIGMDVVAEAEAALERRLRAGLDAVAGSARYHLWDEWHPRIGVATFNLAGLDHGLVASALGAEHGISVRNGCFCAHPLVLRLLAVPEGDTAGIGSTLARGRRSNMPGAVRASTGLTTTAADIDRFVDAVAALATDGPRWTYTVCDTTGDHLPVPDDRPLPAVSFLRASSFA